MTRSYHDHPQHTDEWTGTERTTARRSEMRQGLHSGPNQVPRPD